MFSFHIKKNINNNNAEPIQIQHKNLYKKLKTVNEKNESDCLYVNSRGILKSCDVYCENPISSSNKNILYLIDYIKSQQQSRTTIYVCSETLSYFINTILPFINKSFILVSGDSDLSIPNEAMNVSEFKKLIRHPLLIMWYAQNNITNGAFSKLQTIPIGLDYHTLSSIEDENTGHPWGTKMSPLEQETMLLNVRKQHGIPFYKRKLRIYSNVHFCYDRWNDRKEALEKIPKNLLFLESGPITRENTWIKMAEYQFILSPFGNGFDCHRTWEALLLGCIPIVCCSPINPLFLGLPVLQVEKWSDITEDLLEKCANDFSGITDILTSKLFLQYWTEKIKQGL